MSETVSQAYQTKSAVLFIIFNRPDTTAQVFEQIKLARPAKLYIAADGPRNKPGEEELCAKTRQIINQVDWDCQVFTLLRDSNLGCKNAVSGAIDWFFEQEEEGIILEDDCLPDNSFFRFCDAMLQRYRYDTRIRHICGCNFQRGRRRGGASYYFSNLTHVWGWAGWRRVWQDYDKNLSCYDTTGAEHALKQLFEEPLIVESWLNIFKEVKAGNIDTWDYQLTLINFFNNSLSIIPNQNLISNIGFGANATHTVAGDNPNAQIPVIPLPGDIIHPLYILPEKAADSFTLDFDFNIPAKKKKQNSLKARVKRALK
jgi:hypothetical protein